MPTRRELCLAAVPLLARAQDWPQWRGPNRDAVASAAPARAAWPEKLKLQWKVNIGEGHSSPVVAGGKVYLHSRQGEREVVSCLRPENGQLIWRESYPAPYSVISVAAGHGKGVKSTPVVWGGRICTLGISGILSCFDAQTGKPQWRKTFAAPLYGTAMSPAAENDLLIAHVQKGEGGALIAFDGRTGEEKWSWNGDGPAYTSPIVADVAGVRQVVSQGRVTTFAVSASSGALLWRIPYTTAYDQNIVTPVLYRDLLIFSGLRNPVVAIRVSRRGSGFATDTVWQNRDVPMYMSSPVVSGDQLFGFTNRNSGQFFCLDLRNGSTLWTSGGRQGENATIVDAGTVLLALTTEGQLIVAGKSAKAFEAVRKYTVADSPTWAHLVVVKNGVLIKDATTLAMWQVP